MHKHYHLIQKYLNWMQVFMTARVQITGAEIY